MAHLCQNAYQDACIHTCHPKPVPIFKIIFNILAVSTCFGIPGLINIKFMCLGVGYGKSGNGNRVIEADK